MRSLLASRSVHLAARLALGGVFVFAGVVKIAAPREFARIVVNYQILPENAAVYLAFVLPWIEALLGVLLILGVRVKEISVTVSLLLVAFVGAVLIRSMNGSAAPCGCFSLKSAGPESMVLILGRDLGLLACGAYLVLFGGKRIPQQTRVS
jgi:uncharacterized membrane protein YphA (DoxX/SURF4 family)